MKQKILLLSFLFLSLIGYAQPIDWNKKLPADPNVLIGKLPNGITYYLRHNEEPKDRASFFIIRNAGALLENDDQDGLAHFLEHMAFNGSKNFPGNSMISTLERHGISFGGNLNAYTTQNETVYNISDVPMADESLTDTCLLILHDWSYYLTLDPKDIDEERGVITEEWRTRNNSATRIYNQKKTCTLQRLEICRARCHRRHGCHPDVQARNLARLLPQMVPHGLGGHCYRRRLRHQEYGGKDKESLFVHSRYP